MVGALGDPFYCPKICISAFHFLSEIEFPDGHYPAAYCSWMEIFALSIRSMCSITRNTDILPPNVPNFTLVFPNFLITSQVNPGITSLLGIQALPNSTYQTTYQAFTLGRKTQNFLNKVLSKDCVPLRLQFARLSTSRLHIFDSQKDLLIHIRSAFRLASGLPNPIDVILPR